MTKIFKLTPPKAYGYVDDKGKWIVLPKFDSAGKFYEGFAIVETDGKYGFIKEDGAYLVEPTFDDAEDFC